MKESQQIMMQHSEIKIRLLKLYLERYLKILFQSKYFGDINIYDLFCGEGIYENGGKGSPFIILETIKNIYYSNKSDGKETDKFNCFFNDIDIKKVEKLKERITRYKLYYPEFGTLRFSTLNYREILPGIVKEIESLVRQKAFIFLDPYGYKDIRISDIKTLLKSNKSEVLLFIPTQFMFRFETKGSPESLVNFIDELMPIEQWPVSETGIEFIEKLTEAFRNSLGDNYFVDSFIITREKNQFFCLFFFTSHIYGFEKMLESKWKIDEEEGRGWHSNEIDLFSGIEKMPDTDKFEAKLKEFLKKNFRTNAEIYKFTLRNGHRPCHASTLLLKYQKSSGIIIEIETGKSIRPSAFYLNYKCYKEEPSKIKIRLK